MARKNDINVGIGVHIDRMPENLDVARRKYGQHGYKGPDRSVVNDYIRHAEKNRLNAISEAERHATKLIQDLEAKQLDQPRKEKARDKQFKRDKRLQAHASKLEAKRDRKREAAEEQKAIRDEGRAEARIMKAEIEKRISATERHNQNLALAEQKLIDKMAEHKDSADQKIRVDSERHKNAMEAQEDKHLKAMTFLREKQANIEANRDRYARDREERDAAFLQQRLVGRLKRTGVAVLRFSATLAKVGFVAIAGKVTLFAAALVSVNAALAIGRFSVATYNAALKGLAVTAAAATTAIGIAVGAYKQWQEAQLASYLVKPGSGSYSTRFDTARGLAASRLSRNFSSTTAGLIGLSNMPKISAAMARAGAPKAGRSDLIARNLFNITGGDASAAASLADTIAKGDLEASTNALKGSIGINATALSETNWTNASLLSGIASGSLTGEGFSGLANEFAKTLVGRMKIELAGMIGLFASMGDHLMTGAYASFVRLSNAIRGDLLGVTIALQEYGEGKFLPYLEKTVTKLSGWFRTGVLSNIENVSDYAKNVKDFFLDIQTGFRNFGDWLRSYEDAADVTTEMFKAMGTAAGGRGMFRSFANMVLDNRDAFETFGRSVGYLAGAILDLFALGQNSFFGKLDNVSSTLGTVAHEFVPAIGSLMASMAPILALLPGAIDGLANVLGILAPILESLLRSVGGIGSMVQTLPGGSELTGLLLAGGVMAIRRNRKMHGGMGQPGGGGGGSFLSKMIGGTHHTGNAINAGFFRSGAAYNPLVRQYVTTPSTVGRYWQKGVDYVADSRGRIGRIGQKVKVSTIGTTMRAHTYNLGARMRGAPTFNTSPVGRMFNDPLRSAMWRGPSGRFASQSQIRAEMKLNNLAHRSTLRYIPGALSTGISGLLLGGQFFSDIKEGRTLGSTFVNNTVSSPITQGLNMGFLTGGTLGLMAGMPMLGIGIGGATAMSGGIANAYSTGNTSLWNGLASVGGGAATGAAIGSVIPGVGTAVGAIAGAIVGGIGNAIASYFGGKRRTNNARKFVATLYDRYSGYIGTTGELDERTNMYNALNEAIVSGYASKKEGDDPLFRRAMLQYGTVLGYNINDMDFGKVFKDLGTGSFLANQKRYIDTASKTIEISVNALAGFFDTTANKVTEVMDMFEIDTTTKGVSPYNFGRLFSYFNPIDRQQGIFPNVAMTSLGKLETKATADEAMTAFAYATNTGQLTTAELQTLLDTGVAWQVAHGIPPDIAAMNVMTDLYRKIWDPRYADSFGSNSANKGKAANMTLDAIDLFLKDISQTHNLDYNTLARGVFPMGPYLHSNAGGLMPNATQYVSETRNIAGTIRGIYRGISPLDSQEQVDFLMEHGSPRVRNMLRSMNLASHEMRQSALQEVMGSEGNLDALLLMSSDQSNDHLNNILSVLRMAFPEAAAITLQPPDPEIVTPEASASTEYDSRIQIIRQQHTIRPRVHGLGGWRSRVI